MRIVYILYFKILLYYIDIFTFTITNKNSYIYTSNYILRTFYLHLKTPFIDTFIFKLLTCYIVVLLVENKDFNKVNNMLAK